MWVSWCTKWNLGRFFSGFLSFSPVTNFIPPFLHTHLIHFIRVAVMVRQSWSAGNQFTDFQDSMGLLVSFCRSMGGSPGDVGQATEGLENETWRRWSDLKLSWLRLRERRTFHSLSLLFKILVTSTPSYLSNRFNRLSHFHNLGTRSQQCSVLSIPSHNISLYF